VASGVGLIEIWRRFEGRSSRVRWSILGIVTVVAVYCVAANFAIAAAPSEQMSQSQIQDFLSTEQSLSLSSVADSVQHGTNLPDWAPYGQLYMVGDCSGLYLSSGIPEANVPGLLVEHYTWIPVEQDPAFTHQIWFTFNQEDFTRPVTLMTYGASSLVLEPDGKGYFIVQLKHSGSSIGWPSTYSQRKPISILHEPFQLEVTTDPNLHQILVLWFGTYFITHYIAGPGPAVVHTTPATSDGSLSQVTVTEKPYSSSMSLCRSLQRGG
jgi:hypothetical protein